MAELTLEYLYAFVQCVKIEERAKGCFGTEIKELRIYYTNIGCLSYCGSVVRLLAVRAAAWYNQTKQQQKWG